MQRLAFLTFAGLLVIGCGDNSPFANTTPTTVLPGPMQPNAEVDWVIDGDTIDVIIGGQEERVRLTGIDTPEVSHDASGTRPATIGECFGDEATTFVESLLPVGTPVRLERDVVGRDDYGRIPV